MAALLGRFSAICKALSQGTTRLANNSNVLPSITPTRNWPTLAHHQIRHKCEGPINKCQDFERCKGKKGEIVLKCYGKPKAPCKGPKRQNFEPALKPVKSVWETTPNFECFNHEFPKRLPECMPECNAELTRFDCLFYRPTNDRKYTQTWSECPELKPMECPCIYDHVKVDYVKRPKKCKVEKRDCCLDANKKCVVIGAPCCKKGRIPPKCKKQRTPKKCRKLCCPFPAYSECCQKKPARIPGRPPECFCLRPLPMCVVYRTLERMEAAKSKGRAKKSKEDRKAKKNKEEKKPERYPKC